MGDQYLNDKNNLYEVIKISGDKAYAKFKETVEIERALDLPEAKAMAEATQDKTIKISNVKKEKVIAMYHTHSDESYIPTDGKSSIPYKGGIFKVGSSLKSALEKKGIKVFNRPSS